MTKPIKIVAACLFHTISVPRGNHNTIYRANEQDYLAAVGGFVSSVKKWLPGNWKC